MAELVYTKKNGTRNIVVDKSYDLALCIVKMAKRISAANEFVLSRQILKSGTSIGANINETVSAESKKDFVHKLSISLKETNETIYRLILLHDREYIQKNEFNLLITKTIEVRKILNSIILSTKKNHLGHR